MLMPFHKQLSQWQVDQYIKFCKSMLSLKSEAVKSGCVSSVNGTQIYLT